MPRDEVLRGLTLKFQRHCGTPSRLSISGKVLNDSDSNYFKFDGIVEKKNTIHYSVMLTNFIKDLFFEKEERGEELHDMSANVPNAPNAPRSVFMVNRRTGFLPLQDPVWQLPKRYSELDSILNRMPLTKDDGTPGLLASGKLGETVAQELPLYDMSDVTSPALAMALFRDYTFLASAYLLEPCDIQNRAKGQFGRGRSVLPKNIAVPLVAISEKIGSKPYMEYSQSYALYNWKRKDPKKPIAYDNLELIRKFTGMASEKGFILGHVDMVRYTGKFVSGVIDSLSALSRGDRSSFTAELEKILDVTRDINIAMEKMWRRSKPSDYLKFRTFIMGTKNQEEMFPDGVVYEGVSPEPRFYRGESGANDSIIPTLDNLLQLTEKMPPNELTAILKDFRSYRPKNQEEFLEFVDENARKLQFEKFAKAGTTSRLLYIQLIDQVRDFRARHWNFAKQYIIRQTAYPKATGGSPMATWLPNQLGIILDQVIKNCEEVALFITPGSEMDKIFKRAVTQRELLNQEVELMARNKDKSHL